MIKRLAMILTAMVFSAVCQAVGEASHPFLENPVPEDGKVVNVKYFHAVPVPMLTATDPELQRLELEIESDSAGKIPVRILFDDKVVAENELALPGGRCTRTLLVPPPEKKVHAEVRLLTGSVDPVIWSGVWDVPRKWTLYVMSSSHTDIGLHNSQYFQRRQSEQFIDEAMKVADDAEARGQAYSYMMEGSWFWNNYGMDRGRKAAEMVRDRYIRKGKMGVCCGIAGNHTQTFGLEEMCRSAYARRELLDRWGIGGRTMAMIDNNGMSWSIVAPYAEAGYENIIFAPNQWNPLPSTVWPADTRARGYLWNPNAGGGGSRIDIRYDSSLPMVFFWQAPDRKHRLLVWGSTQYNYGGSAFGLSSAKGAADSTIREMEDLTGLQLAKMAEKIPYDIWLFACYDDDERPNRNLSDVFARWNRKWKWPRFEMLEDADVPFDLLKKRFGDRIPVLSGDITGGWYQHPAAAPEYLADKFAADRLLPTAEKLSVLASAVDSEYRYPAEKFHRAWNCLLQNDEHSYGVSGYQGRRVYETWLQHRDWIDRAMKTAETEAGRALHALAAKIDLKEPATLFFNPCAFPRRELVVSSDGLLMTPEIPAFGYRAAACEYVPETRRARQSAPIVENQYYRIAFADDGSISSLFDKEFQREVLDRRNRFHGNQFVYTNDNHKTFFTPGPARFEIADSSVCTRVFIFAEEPVSGAEIRTIVTIPAHEKRIDFDNELLHVRDLKNDNRYYRYGYYAFPFAVENAKRLVHLNGCVADAGAGGRTGHGTETYSAVREWCCAENGSFGAALFQLDSQLVEFDHIHPDKTDCFMKESGSAVYAYLFNDWLQMHTPGGSHVNLRFRFSVTSYGGDFRKAGIPRIAERLANPLLSVACAAHKGTLPAARSFLELPAGERLLALKRADDGSGVILRIQETDGLEKSVELHAFNGYPAKRCSVDERSIEDDKTLLPFGTASFRIPGLTIPEKKEPVPQCGDVPAPIGSWYTGLITEPRVCCGAESGQMYLIWGQNMEPDLAGYELYRSEKSGFVPGKENFVAKVEPGPFRVALYEDTGLKEHTQYHYRVRAVNRNGVPGAFSEEFSGWTREL